MLLIKYLTWNTNMNIVCEEYSQIIQILEYFLHTDSSAGDKQQMTQKLHNEIPE